MTATIWLRPLGQAWQPVGTESDRGAWHEGLECVSDQGGPKGASFRLLRSRRGLYGDLLARTPVMIEVGGVRVWSGRTSDAPESSGAARQIDVQCEGWQAHLDGDAYERVYVHTKLSDYKDSRTILTANLAALTQGWNVATDSGVITLGVANGTVIAGGTGVGVTLDLGASTGRRIVVSWESSNNAIGVAFTARGSSSPDAATAGSDAISISLSSGASGTTAGTFGADERYVHLLLGTAGGFTAGADIWLKLKSVQVFADTAYESGNASILAAGVGIRDALTRATTLLNPDWSGIGEPGFAFPEFAPDGPRTAREAVAAFNAPSNWIFKIDEYQRPVYKARPTVPVVEFGAWPGNESDGGSSNSAEGVVTKVVVRGTGPDGAPLSATRTQTGTIVDRQGDAQAAILTSPGFALNTALANQLGDAHLAAHKASPFKGTVTVAPGGARRASGGLALHPAHLLLLTGELARRADLIDPDTGAVARNVTIDTVTYRDDAQASEVALDNTRTDFEALNARLGLLVPAA